MSENLLRYVTVKAFISGASNYDQVVLSWGISRRVLLANIFFSGGLAI